MKKILRFLFAIVILGCGGYFVYVNYIKSKVPKLNLEEEVSNASKYYVYGNHFQILLLQAQPTNLFVIQNLTLQSFLNHNNSNESHLPEGSVQTHFQEYSPY